MKAIWVVSVEKKEFSRSLTLSPEDKDISSNPFLVSISPDSKLKEEGRDPHPHREKKAEKSGGKVEMANRLICGGGNQISDLWR